MSKRLLATVLALAALAAGCGGDELRAEEVPGAPPPLPLPTAEDAAPGAAAPDTGADTGATGADGADEADTGTDTTTAPPTDTGGATLPEATPEATPVPQDPAETGGADAEEGLDQFCADNPGAC